MKPDYLENLWQRNAFLSIFTASTRQLSMMCNRSLEENVGLLACPVSG